MSKNTSILLNEHFDIFINSQISTGKYNSASEVIRSALRLLEQEENKLKLLQIELEKGENSKFNKNFNSKINLEKLHKKYV